MDFKNHTGQSIENDSEQPQAVNDDRLHSKCIIGRLSSLMVVVRLTQICKHWDSLLPIMRDRASSNPGGLYHTGSQTDEARGAFMRKSGMGRETSPEWPEDDDEATSDDDDFTTCRCVRSPRTSIIYHNPRQHTLSVIRRPRLRAIPNPDIACTQRRQDGAGKAHPNNVQMSSCR